MDHMLYSNHYLNYHKCQTRLIRDKRDSLFDLSISDEENELAERGKNGVMSFGRKTFGRQTFG
jgi:hypothetical protein